MMSNGACIHDKVRFPSINRKENYQCNYRKTLNKTSLFFSTKNNVEIADLTKFIHSMKIYNLQPILIFFIVNKTNVTLH